MEEDYNFENNWPRKKSSVCFSSCQSRGHKVEANDCFKGAKREVAALHQEFKSQVYIASSSNVSMNTELTNQWENYVLGSFTFYRRILAWDSYQCHIGDSVIKSLNAKKVDMVIVPGGRTKYIQAPVVLWNKPFEEACTENDDWMGTVGIHNETAAGNLRAPPERKIVIHWILQSWTFLPT